MTTLMKLIVALGVDTSEYEKGLTDAQKIAKTKMEGIGSTLSSVGQSMTKAGALMTAGLTVPIVAGMAKSIDAASDLNETVSKVGIVFGETSDQVLKFGENAATSMGMSKNEALAAAGTFGNLFRALDLSEQSSADMSTSLITLSADLASFNNMSPDEVLEKLRSGLVGETEPLRSLGVNINQAMVEAKAMEMGLTSLTGELTPAAAAQARYALIMEQTGLAQGDFARTSDGLANQQRILSAQLSDMAATLGQNLLPIAVQVVGALNGMLAAFNNMPAPMQKALLVGLAFLAALGPVVTIIGTITTAVGGLTTAWATIGPIVTGTVLPALAAISAPVLALIAAIGLLVAAIVIFGKDAWNTLTMLSAIWKEVIGNVIVRNLEVFKAAIEGIANAIRSLISWVGSLASSFSNLKIPDWLTPGSPTPLEMGIRGISNAMKSSIDNVLPQYSAELSMQSMGGEGGMEDAAPALEIDYQEMGRVFREAIAPIVG